MKTAIRLLGSLRLECLFAAAAAAFFTPAAVHGSDRWETLQAIHLIENPHDSPRPGRFGELGAYQFRETTWRMHTSVPFGRAVERRVSDEVAVAHYEWLKNRLERNGKPVTPYTIAAAWNAGVGAVLRDRVPAVTRDYAERAVNLAEDLKRSRVASAR